MAGKPEPPQNHIQHQHHQQQANVQNVVVYVSNDNFAAQAYASAVNQQNVASYTQQQPQQNGGTPVSYAASAQSVAPIVAPVKNLNKPLLKAQDFSGSNGLIGNVSLAQQASFYASNPGIVQANGFHHGHGSNVINNIAYSNNNVGHSGPILNQGFGNIAPVKGLVNLGHPNIGQQQAVCPSSIELSSTIIGNSNEQLCNGYSIVPQPAQAIVQQQHQPPPPQQQHTQQQQHGQQQPPPQQQQQQQQRVAVSCAQTYFGGPEQKTNTPHEASGNSVSVPQSLTANNYITTQGGDAANVVAVMGGDVSGASASVPSSGAVVFPRCDSVRSETAESSCSSLSSADSQPDANANSLTLLLPPTAAGHQVTSVNNQLVASGGNSNIIPHNSGAVPPVLNNASGMVMLNNGVNVQQPNPPSTGIVRTPSGAISLSQQQLGNIVLAMTVPPNATPVNNNSAIPASNQSVVPSVAVQPVVQSITVPFGWKRLNINGGIVYISPSNTALSSLEHLKEYLQTQGTCKCGLECPLKCDAVFNFDPKVATRPWTMPPPSDSTVTSGDLTKLCNHKRKLLAMATLAAGPGFNSQHSAQQGAVMDGQLSKTKKDSRVGRNKKRKISGPYSGVSVSQLLAQRERGVAAGVSPNSKDQSAGRTPQQNWNSGASPSGASQNQVVPPSSPQTPNQNRAAFPPPSFSSEQPNMLQGVHTSPQFLRYTSPNTGVAPSIMGNNIMVHPNASPVHLNNLSQQQQNLIGVSTGTQSQPMVNIQSSAPQHGQNVEQTNAQATGSNNSAPLQHSGAGTPTAVTPNSAINPGVMMAAGTGAPTCPVVMGAGGMMVHGNAAGNHAILCQQPQQRLLPINSNPDEVHSSGTGNTKAMQEQQMQLQQQNQQIMYSGIAHSSNNNQNSQEMQMLRMQQSFYGQQYHISQDQNKLIMQQQQQQQNQQQHQQQQQPPPPPPPPQPTSQQHSALLQNARQQQQQQAFVPASCNSGNTGNVCVEQYGENKSLHIPGAVPHHQQHQQSHLQQQLPNMLPMQQQQQQQQPLPPHSHHQMAQANTVPTSGVMMHQQKAPPWQNRNTASGAVTTMPMMTMHQQHHVMPTPSQANSLPAPNTYDRVPPLHHHTPPPPVWTEDASRKKSKGPGKSTSGVRKQRPYSIEHHHRLGIMGAQSGVGSANSVSDSHAPCPNIDVRQIPVEHNRPPPTHSTSNDMGNTNYAAGSNPNIPSFMEDPSGYLAQQTALLNSTISRQTGVGAPNFMCHSPVRNPATTDQVSSPQSAPSNLPVSCSSPITVGIPLPSNVLLPNQKGPGLNPRTNSNIPMHQSNLIAHASVNLPVMTSQQNENSNPASVSISAYSQQQNQGSVINVGVPDSSILPEHRMEMTNHCHGCVVNSGTLLQGPIGTGAEGMMFHHQVQHQQLQAVVAPEHAALTQGNRPHHQQQHMQQQQQQQPPQSMHNTSGEFKRFLGQHVSSCASTPSETISQQNSSNEIAVQSVTHEENPVTSSTFDRLGNSSDQHQQQVPTSNARGPIQGGTVSTSNGSPVETYTLPQPEASPTSSTPTSSQSCRMPETPSSSSSVYISSSSSSSSSPFTVPNVSPTGLYSYPNHSQNHFQPTPKTEVSVASSTAAPTRTHSNSRPAEYCHHLMEQSRGSKISLQCSTMVTTMASGHTVSSNTITSVLAGKANTATVTVGNPVAPTSNTPPTSVMPLPTQTVPPLYTSQAAMVAVPQSSVSLAAEQGAQSIQISTVTKSPLEMVQSVVSSIQVPHQQQQPNLMATANGMQPQQQPNQQQQQSQPPPQAAAILKTSGGHSGLPPGHILVSSGGQLIMANTGMAPGPAGLMAPPPQPPPPQSMAKLVSHSSMPPMSVSPMVTSVTAAVTQVIPAVGVAQQVLGQPTVLVNALPAPLLIQPGVMTVDGMTSLNQNAMQIPLAVATGNVIHHSQGPSSAGNGIGQLIDSMNQDPSVARNAQNAQSSFIRHQQPALLSPPDMSHPPPMASGNGKKKGSKKRKVPPQTVASMLHIASQQNSPGAQAAGLVMSQQQQQQNFPQQSFTMSSPHQNIATTGPMLQALTIVPGKAGAPAQILMNGQPGATAGHFGTQQLIATPATSQHPQQINLLQPVNLLNGATGVVQNFPTFQQFIVPSLGGMVMATDGTTTLLPDTTNIGVQLQLQNVNGQNVLTPVQSHGGTAVFGHPTGQSILAAGPAGMVIRTPSTGGKMTTGQMIQQQSGGGPQFLTGSPNGGQFLMNSAAAFGGQLSPLVANVSPNQQMSFTTNTSPVRPTAGTHPPQQEFIQCGQMGQTLMVPCTVPTSQSHQNTTVVQQNTTIVQQQTTMVSNNQHHLVTAQPNNATNNVGAATTLNVSQQNFIVENSMQADKLQQSPLPQQTNNAASSPPIATSRHSGQAPAMMKHSVSTQTAVNQSVQASSSPLVTPGSLVVTTNNTFCQTSASAASGGSPPDTTTHSPIDPGSANGSIGVDGRPQTPAVDTTIHSTGVGSTDDGLSSPSPSSCTVTGSCNAVGAISENMVGRQQSSCVTASPMPMVHCVSSSNEQDITGIGEQTEYDWGVSSGKSIFVSPSAAEGGFNSNASSPQQPDYTKYVSSDMMVTVTAGAGHLLCDNESRRKSGGNMYVESSTVTGISTYGGTIGSGSELLSKQQESVVSSRQIYEYGSTDERRTLNSVTRSSVNTKICSSSSNVGIVTERGAKRKHMDALVVMESHTHDIHSMEEDDEESAVADEGSKSLSEGDLVWGAARGFPEWPGKLVGPVSKEDKVWVRWFGGDRALTQVPVHTLKTLSEGLEAHHRARKKLRKSRKLNSQLENAIQEAMLELDRMTEQAASSCSAKLEENENEMKEKTARRPRRNAHR